MCGITGIFDTRTARPVARSVLHRMNESQAHRGPDEGGLITRGPMTLGVRRLAIIDPQEGHQPWQSDDAPPLDGYPKGDWGPDRSDKWMHEQGRQWFDVCPVLH